MKFTPHAAQQSHIQYTCYVPCRHSWIHGGMCVKYQTCEAGRSKMCFCLVWCLLSCSTGGGGPACFNIEKVVCAIIVMRKKSYPFAKPNLQGVVLKSGLGTHWWWLTGIAPVSDPQKRFWVSNSLVCRWKPCQPSRDWTWLGGAYDLLVEYAVVLSKTNK